MTAAGTSERSARNGIVQNIVDAITARHGTSHMGAAWLHAHDFLDKSVEIDSEITTAVADRAIASYDHHENGEAVDDDPRRSDHVDPQRHAGWTPFNDAQIAQSVRLVSVALSGLTPRYEFVLRHAYGIGIPANGWRREPSDPHGKVFSIREISERLGLSKARVDQNFNKAHRMFDTRIAKGPDHPHRMMRAALDQLQDAEVEYLWTASDPTFRCAIRHDHAFAIASTENRVAEKMMNIFPELGQMRDAMVDAPPREQMNLICSDWASRSNEAYSEAIRMDRDQERERSFRSDLHRAWINRTSDENAILREIDIVTRRSGLEMTLVPALHAGNDRKYRVLATYRGRTSDEVAVRIPSGTPLPGTICWAHHFPVEMLYDVRDSLTQFAIAVLAREKAESNGRHHDDPLPGRKMDPGCGNENEPTSRIAA